MIILSENKQNHYLIKNFLIEANIISEQHKDVQLELKPISNIDNPNLQTIIDTPIFDENAPASDPMIDKVIKKHSKFSGLKKLLAKDKRGKLLLNISILAIVLLWYGYFQQASEIIANDNNINQAEITQIMNGSSEISSPKVKELATNDEFDEEVPAKEFPAKEVQQTKAPEVSAEKSIAEKAEQRIKSFENYVPYPYQDRSGISVGYGTQFLRNTSIEDLPEDWKNKLYEHCGFSDSEIKTLLSTDFSDISEAAKDSIDAEIAKIEEKLAPDYKIKYPEDHVKALKRRIRSLERKKTKIDDRGVISVEIADRCFSKDLNSILSSAITRNFTNQSLDFYSMDPDVQMVVIDMYYNIGEFFLETTYKNFYRELKEYITALESGDSKKITEALDKLHENIKNKSPEYHKQNNKRASANVDLLSQALERSKQVKENKSLKDAYLHLFV